MSVFRETWGANAEYIETANHGAIWIQSGSVNRNNVSYTEGTGIYLAAGDLVIHPGSATVQLLRFTISNSSEPSVVKTKNIASTLVLSSNISTELKPAVLRLDQVDFPPAAIAYRHTHPGAGIRYLVHGGLQIESAHSTEHIVPETAWFEDADSPVEATAIETETSRFVRLMLLPLEYEGKPTLTLLNDADANKPRLQSNTRHFDKRIELDSNYSGC